MEKINKTVKTNINFLEFPMFLPKRNTFDINEYSIGEKFKMLTLGKAGLPNAIDKRILYKLMFKLQEINKNKKDPELTLQFKSAYELLDLLEYSDKDDKSNNERVWLSLQRWWDTEFHFSKSFYKNKEEGRIDLKVKVLCSMQHQKNKKGVYNIEISFSPKFYNLIENENFCMNLQLNTLLLLPDEAFRMYELIIKSFHKKNSFDISLKKLKNKLGFTTEHDCRIIEKIKNCLKRINKYDELYDYEIKQSYYGNDKISIKRIPKTFDEFVQKKKEKLEIN